MKIKIILETSTPFRVAWMEEAHKNQSLPIQTKEGYHNSFHRQISIISLHSTQIWLKDLQRQMEE